MDRTLIVIRIIVGNEPDCGFCCAIVDFRSIPTMCVLPGWILFSRSIISKKIKVKRTKKKKKKRAKISHNILTNLEVKLTVFYHIITPTYTRCLNAPRDV